VTSLARIVSVRAEPLDIELVEPFGIASGAQALAANVLVSVELEDGSIGIGEAAPFPAVSGETQASTLAVLAELGPALQKEPPRGWRAVARWLAEAAPAAPAARCAVETALLDALCRRSGWSMFGFFGGAAPQLRTDITITTGSVEHARERAASAARDGFDVLKVKTGGVTHDEDRARVEAVMTAAPSARLVLDANESWSADEAVALLESLGARRERVVLLEQPTPAADLDGLRVIRERSGIAVAADESARSARDVVRLAETRAADVVNLKITKTGIAEALDMLAVARALGLGLMVGGMVESVLTMSVSACIAAGHGGFSFVDLDTPLFLKNSPLFGGFAQSGPHIDVGGIERGHGVVRP